MTTFTKKELQQIADTDHVQCGDAAAMARLLLAALNAQPVASCTVEDGNMLIDGFGEYADHSLSDGTHDLYAIPQLSPGVPEDVPDVLRDEIIDLCDGYEIGDAGAQEIWSACRATILEGNRA